MGKAQKSASMYNLLCRQALGVELHNSTFAMCQCEEVKCEARGRGRRRWGAPMRPGHRGELASDAWIARGQEAGVQIAGFPRDCHPSI